MVNFGYSLGKNFQGKGYAKEAGFEVYNKVFNALDIRIVLIACDARNEGSKNLANKILIHLIEQNETEFDLKAFSQKQTIKTNDGNVIYHQFFLQKQ